jgi:hypothetical protein
MRAVVRADGRAVGKLLCENGCVVYETRRDPSRHLCRKFRAWGIDTGVLDEIVAAGAATVRVVADGRLEEADVGLFLTKGIRADLGDGPQVFLPRNHFRRSTATQLNLGLD